MADVKILLVEDESIEAVDIKRTLESFGYNVAYVASSSEEAVKKALEIMPDLILMDIVLKDDSDVIEAVSKIKDLNIPVIYLTAHSEESTIERAKLTEPYGYIIKPYDSNELKYAIELALYKNKLENKLKESEKKFRHILENSLDATYRRNLETDKYDYLSPVIKQVLGYSAEEFISMPSKKVVELIHPDDRENVDNIFANALSGKTKTYNIEYRFKQKDGHYKWINDYGSIFKDDNSILLVGSVRDIDDRKKIEKILQDSEKKYRTIVETTHEGVAIGAPDGGFLYVNQRMCDMLGYEKEELIGHDILEFMDEDQKTLIKNSRKRCEKDKFEMECKFRKKDGSTLYTLVQVSPLYDSQGKHTANLSMHTDITNRKKEDKKLLMAVEDELRESEEFNRLTLSSISDAVFITDNTGIFTFIYPNVGMIFGFSFSEVEKMGKISKLLGEKDIFRIGDLERLGEIRNIECDITDKSREIHNLLVTIKKVSIKGGTHLYTCRDITERKKAEDALKKSYTELENRVEERTNELKESNLQLEEEIDAHRRADETLRNSEDRLRLKLDSILSPDVGIEEDELSNIIDSQALQSLMDEFYAITKMGIGIIDLKGNVLVGTGWQDICTKFHRVNPETRKNCTQSDLVLSKGVKPGEFRAYKCKNNMWDIVTPIFIGDKHVGNVFLGQFFYEDEVPEYELFAAQADKYGFNKEEYLTTLDAVPRWSRERIQHLMRFYAKFAAQISKLGHSNLKLAKTIVEKEKAEEELKLANLYNRSLIEASLDPLVTIGPDGKITDVNKATEKVTGFSRYELVGTDFSIYFTDPDKARGGYEQVFKEGFVRDYPLEIQHKKGHITPVLYNASLYKNEEGEVVGVFAAARDISERKEIEDKLKESEERMRITLEVAKIGLWDWDVKNDRWFASITYYSMLGYKPSAGPGNRQEWLDRVHPDDRSMVKEKIDSVLVQNFSSYEYEARMLHADGTYRWVLVSGFSIERDKGKKAARILGIRMDITERKKAEEDLKESENHLKIAMDLSKVVNWEYDTKSDMFTFNDQFYALYKTTAEQEGSYIMSSEDYASKFVPPEESSMVAEAIAEVLETDDPNFYKQLEHSIIRADGEKRYIIVRFGIVKDESGQTIKTYGANQDITELKEVEYALRKSLDEKEVLLREIHHRVKNNLQIIASLLHLQEVDINEEEMVDVLKESEGRVKSMAMIHEKLYQSPTFSDINFKQYVEKLVYDILYTYRIPTRSIKTKLNIENITLNIDTAIPLGLIINELVTNSVKHAFTQPKGTITIKLKSLHEQMELTIADNGIGLPKNIDPENTETLGLKLVNSLVNQIDGKIKLDRTNGTEFKIIFNEVKYKKKDIMGSYHKILV